MNWTERYLAAALRSIPAAKRADVEQELRSSIEDGIEERIAAGADGATAERAVLESLGDPSLLAAAYTGKPNYLIGPELFPIYRSVVPKILGSAYRSSASSSPPSQLPTARASPTRLRQASRPRSAPASRSPSGRPSSSSS